MARNEVKVTVTLAPTIRAVLACFRKMAASMARTQRTILRLEAALIKAQAAEKGVGK